MLKLACPASNGLGRGKRTLQHGQHRFAQVSQMRKLPLSVDKLAPEFLFQLLHALGQGRLRDVAQLRGTREIKRACNS